MNTEYSAQVRDRVIAQLSDAVLGFNAQLATVATAYGITPYTLDFTSASRNFFEGPYDPENLDSTSVLKYPIACLYVNEAANVNDQMFQTFSGPAVMTFDLWLSWRASGAPQNTEKLANATEAAIIRTFCNPDNQANLTGPVTYDRKIRISRGRIEMGGQNWRQLLRTTLVFQLDTN
jgi:hypothetical protein